MSNEILELLKEAQARIFVHCGDDELYYRISKALDRVEGEPADAGMIPQTGGCPFDTDEADRESIHC